MLGTPSVPHYMQAMTMKSNHEKSVITAAKQTIKLIVIMNFTSLTNAL